jgi:hypothetical protein
MLHRKPFTAPRLGLALGVAVALAATATAFAQAPVSYPPSRSVNDLAGWLQRDTPVTLSQVVDISPSAVTAVTSAAPTGTPRGFLANIVSEALDPQIITHEGVASWSIPVDVDCDKRQVRLGPMTGFRTRDLTTDPRGVRDADTAWVNPAANAPLGAVVRALCDRDFHRPFEGRKFAVAKPAPIPAAPKPAPAKAAPPKPAPTQLAENDQAAPAAADSPHTPALRPSIAPSAAPAKAKPAAPPASGGASGVAVQIGASPSLPDAQGLLVKAKKKFAGEMGGHSTEVVTAEVDGKTVHRVLITGFSSAPDATALCEKLKAAGQACFVRR